MIAQLKDLDRQVEEIAKEFPGEVVGIRYDDGFDWTGDPAIFFRILLSDDASRREVLGDVTGRISSKLFDTVLLSNPDYIPYFNFRSKSEQEKLKDPTWPSPTIS